MNWKPIERYDFDNPIWVLKYDMFFDDSGQFCNEDTPGARKFTDCHGWYKTQEDAMRVRAHFPDPSKYHIEKVHQRILLDAVDSN